MVPGMATKKYTVTLPEELAEEIRSEDDMRKLCRAEVQVRAL